MHRYWPRNYKIVEVGPRDGIQNVRSRILTPEVKASYINLLLGSGLRNVEVGSFVSDSMVQMKNTREVLKLIDKPPGANLIALVGSKRYAEEAVTYPIVDTLAVFTTVSESFCQKNNGSDIHKNMLRIKDISRIVLEQNKRLRGYVSCVFGCPFEGYPPDYIEKTVRVAKDLFDLGCYEVSIADTIGTATEEMIAATLKAFARENIDLKNIAIHLHDPRGVAQKNLALALACGIRTVDCATNPSNYIGFGGCPNSPDPSSNIDTLKVLKTLEHLGFGYSVDSKKIEIAAKYIDEQL